MAEARRISEGARLVRQHCERAGLTPHALCEQHNERCKEHKLDYAQLHRALSGVRSKRVSVDFAVAVKCATGGEVDTSTWASNTLRADRPRKTPTPAHGAKVTRAARAAAALEAKAS